MSNWRTDCGRDAGWCSYPNENSVKLYKLEDRNGVWPSDLAAYYDKLDAERCIPKANLGLGYGWSKQRRGK